MSINTVTVSGNLTRDPELKSTSSGIAVLNLGIAVNDRKRNPQTGEWEDVPGFYDLVMFGTRAESIARYLAKGTKVCVHGKLRWSQWERDGQKRSKVEIIVEDIEFMSRGQQQPYQPQPITGYQPQAMGQEQMTGVARQAMPQQYPQQGLYEEPVPF